MLAFVAIATFLAGHALSERLWRARIESGDLEPFERATSSAVIGLSVLVALTWVLAVPRLLFRGTLMAGAAIVALMGVSALWRQLRSVPRERIPTTQFGGADSLARVAALVALVMWFAFVVWRALRLFVLNHDGLAYHMPRAVELARAHGYAIIEGADERVSMWPANYELLLADIILLDGSDRRTGIIGPFTLLLFLIVIAGVTQRWWGRGLHVLVAVLLSAAVPIVLLHAGAHKNDLFCGALYLGSAHFAARWAARLEIESFVLGVVGVGLALGTKLQGFMLVAGVGPVLAYGLYHYHRERRPAPKHVALALVVLAAGLCVLGSVAYVVNVVLTGRPFALVSKNQGFGDWANLWRYPYLVVTAPFSDRAPTWVWAPWTKTYWFAPTYDLWLSNYGMLTSVLVALLPLGIIRYRRQGSDAVQRINFERALVAFSLLVLFVLILPIRVRPVGLFMSSTRFTMFVPVLVVLWTLVPLTRELGRRVAWSAPVIVLLSTVHFGWEAYKAATRDPYQPIDFVEDVESKPDLARFIPTNPYRAPSAADAMAGPDDRIAFDGAYDSWAYPLYGKDLRRHIVYVHGENGPVTIPADVRFVVIDRSYNCFFGHPGFTDTGQWDQYIGRGTPPPEDLVVFRQLSQDPRFKLVYRQERLNQAVFQRREP